MNTKLLVLALTAAIPASIFGIKRVTHDTSEARISIRLIDRSVTSSIGSETLFALPLVGERACSEVSVHEQSGDYDLKLCRDGGDAQTPIVRITLSEVTHGEPPNHAVAFKVIAKLSGSEAVLGEIQESTGGLLTVLARNLGSGSTPRSQPASEPGTAPSRGG